MKKIKIMLVDDQMLLREGLKTIINLQDDMEVIAEADNGKVAINQMKINPADVILMDIQMPVLNGVEATSIIKTNYPNTSIVILTTFDDDDYIIDALANGADGYILKDIGAEHLVRAIHDASRGEMMLPSKIASKLALRLTNRSRKVTSHLPNCTNSSQGFTTRENEIASLMAKNFSNRQIARELFLSEGTVKNYISEIYTKLGTNDRDQAVMLIQQINEE